MGPAWAKASVRPAEIQCARLGLPSPRVSGLKCGARLALPQAAPQPRWPPPAWRTSWTRLKRLGG